jgi:hypothetical protein
VTQVSLGARADAQTVEVPLLETVSPEAGAMPEKPPAAAAPIATRPQGTSSAPRDEPAKGPNWLGYTLVGAGGAVLLTGGYFGLRALSLKAESDRYFNGEHCTQQSCVDDWESAKDAALVSNVCFGVGAAVLGTGVYVFLRPPGDEQGSRAQKALGFSVRPSKGGARASGFVEF